MSALSARRMRQSAVWLLTVFLALHSSARSDDDRRRPAESRPPNIIYFLSDELGYYELSALGHPHLQTPNIDRMIREGMRFTQCLAGSSVCAPTRCCLLTGKHSGHTSVRLNGGGTPMRSDEATIASLLKSAGYATGGFGKWGCGGRGSTGVPETHGFDIFFGYYDQVHAHSYFPPYLIRNSEEVPLANNRGRGDGETYSHYEIFNAALEFMRENRDQPFFCYLPATPPHGIFSIPDDDPSWAIFKDRDWPEDARRYAAMVHMVDRNVGQVLALVKELNLDEQTLVFFSGDNGGADYFASREHPRGLHGANVHPQTGVEFRGKKGTLYEGGLRIPFVARWPGKIPAGVVSEQLCYFPDILPTICEATGVTPPADIDGLSLLPTLTATPSNGPQQKQHDFLYWELNNQTAVRLGDWKGVRPRPQSDWELYNLKSDPSEAKNIAAEHPEVLARVQRAAVEAHTPVEEGTFHQPELHQRDRQAKFGFGEPMPKNAPAASRATRRMSPQGLLPREDWKVLSVSSEADRRPATAAIDGDPQTWWHTAFRPQPAPAPHELVIDLGEKRIVTGFRYLPRQDNSWNGVVHRCEFALATDVDAFGDPVATASFSKQRDEQEIACPPTRARFVRLRILSEVNGGPWGSVAELGVLGK